MTVSLENEQDQQFDFDFEQVARQVAEAVLDQEGCPYEACVNVILTGDEEIRSANRQFRQIDRSTDVLSFPMVDFPAPASYEFLEEDPGCFHPDTGELLMGDIMISIPTAVRQAAAYGHGILREYAFLIAHSMLHLLGYDHMEEEERVLMEKKQEQVLNVLHITR